MLTQLSAGYSFDLSNHQLHTLADGAYIAVPGVVTPQRRNSPAYDPEYNRLLSAARIRVEHAIAKLKMGFAVVRGPYRGRDWGFYQRALYLCASLHNLKLRANN